MHQGGIRLCCQISWIAPAWGRSCFQCGSNIVFAAPITLDERRSDVLLSVHVE
jgi:hypothetical protein